MKPQVQVDDPLAQQPWIEMRQNWHFFLACNKYATIDFLPYLLYTYTYIYILYTHIIYLIVFLLFVVRGSLFLPYRSKNGSPANFLSSLFLPYRSKNGSSIFSARCSFPTEARTAAMSFFSYLGRKLSNSERGKKP